MATILAKHLTVVKHRIFGTNNEHKKIAYNEISYIKRTKIYVVQNGDGSPQCITYTHSVATFIKNKLSFEINCHGTCKKISQCVCGYFYKRYYCAAYALAFFIKLSLGVAALARLSALGARHSAFGKRPRT